MISNRIAFLTSSHSPFDDRIFYHLAKSLSKFNKINIISSTINISKLIDNIIITGFDGNKFPKSKKVEFFYNFLIEFKPSVIISSEPLPIIAAYKYKKKCKERIRIIYDITEWYPSKKNIEGICFPKNIIIFLKLLFSNIFISSLCNGFIFGEYYKSIPYRLLFPFKKWEIITYFPSLDYIKFKKARLKKQSICLGYSGRISTEKGINNIIEVAKAIKLKEPELAIKIKIIGWFNNIKDKDEFFMLCRKAHNIQIEILDRQNFEIFSERLQDIDIFLDLRKAGFENQRCLPIKLFYYAGCGRPVIYTNLKSIRREVNVSQFGYLVNPMNKDIISNYIIKYIHNPFLYYRHCVKARKLSEEKYNWQNIEPSLCRFIKKFQ